MDHENPSVHPSTQVSPTRRLVAAGFIRRATGRILTIDATGPRVTGTIAKRARVAELHRLASKDYESGAARREQDHRADAFLVEYASEAVAAR